jgi:predicted nuclease of predicted toxin-antitoxin system
MAEAPRLFIALYTDEDVTSELAPAVRDRGFEAQSAAEARLLNSDDTEQLAYAAEHNMALLTANADHFLKLAKQYAEAGRSHAGIIISSEQYSRRRFGELLWFVLRLVNSVTAELCSISATVPISCQPQNIESPI